MGNLKQMNLSKSEFLTTTPDFSEVPNLEILILDWCISLSDIDPSIGLLQKLIELGLQGCKNLKRLPSTIAKLKSLEHLNVFCCLDLEGLPERLGDMKSFMGIDVSGSGIKELPDSIGYLDKLTALSLESCGNLKRLPNTIINLKSLEELNVSKCSSLEELPEHLGDKKSLTRIKASKSGIKKLPDSIGLLDKLDTLTRESCDNLQCLPSTVTNLKLIENLDIFKCSDLEELPEHLGDTKWLKELEASFTGIKELPDSIGDLCELKYLKLRGCKFLKSLPNSIGKMTSLELLDISGTAIKKLPRSIGLLIHLRRLLLDDCNLSDGDLPDNLQRLSCLKVLRLSQNNFCTLPFPIACLSNLKYLNISRNNFEILPSFIGHLSHLQGLCLSENHLFTLPSSIAQLSNLNRFDLSGNNCCSLTSSIAQLSNLTELDLNNCRSLQSILDLPPNLRVLYADNCTSLKKLSIVSNFKLSLMVLRNCSSLVEIQGLENVINSVRKIHLQGCSSSFSTTTMEVFLSQEPVEDHHCHLYLSGEDISNWFEYQGMGDSAICFDVPLCVPDDSYHFFIWLDFEWKVYGDDGDDDDDYSVGILVTNKTCDSEWSNLFNGSYDNESFASSCVIHLGCSNRIKCGDSIEVSFITNGSYRKLGKCGVHVAHKSKRDTAINLPINFIKERVPLKRGLDVNEVETSCKRSRPSDNFKLPESISLKLISPLQTSTSTDPLHMKQWKYGVHLPTDFVKGRMQLKRGLDVNGVKRCCKRRKPSEGLKLRERETPWKSRIHST